MFKIIHFSLQCSNNHFGIFVNTSHRKYGELEGDNKSIIVIIPVRK